MRNQTHGFGGKHANANRRLSLHRAIASVTACHLDNDCTSVGRGWLLMGIDLRQPAVICQACTDHASNLDRFKLNMRVMHFLRRVSHAQRPITCIKTWFLKTKFWGRFGHIQFREGGFIDADPKLLEMSGFSPFSKPPLGLERNPQCTRARLSPQPCQL
jgi:hypothetical protein